MLFNPLSTVSFASGAEEKCHRSCQEAVRCSPSNPEAHQMMASCLLSMNQIEVCVFGKYDDVRYTMM